MAWYTLKFIYFIMFYIWVKTLYIYLIKYKGMGIARKVPKINWLSSFGLIIVAGTLYRVSKINRKIMEV